MARIYSGYKCDNYGKQLVFPKPKNFEINPVPALKLEAGRWKYNLRPCRADQTIQWQMPQLAHASGECQGWVSCAGDSGRALRAGDRFFTNRFQFLCPSV